MQLAPRVCRTALLEKHLVQNKQVSEEMKGAQSLSKYKAAEMGHSSSLPSKYHKTCSVFRKLSETELLAHFGHLITRTPEHWAKQENYVPMNTRCFKYSCCWNCTWEKCLYPLDLFLQRPISSTVWYIGHFSRMGTALGVSDIRIELQGRISSGWGGDFVQEAVSKSPLPGILKPSGERKIRM